MENLSQSINWSVARCRLASAVERDLFFSDEIAEIAQAKALCAECPLREACYQVALQRREPCGVWGGELFQNGEVLAFKRRRGRPRKDEQLTATA